MMHMCGAALPLFHEQQRGRLICVVFLVGETQGKGGKKIPTGGRQLELGNVARRAMANLWE